MSLICHSLISQQYWLQQPCPTTKYLTRVVFVDTSYGWASGDSGVVIHTTNGGASWAVQQTGTDVFVEDIFFLNRQIGWLIANDFGPEGTYFFKTTNGGSNWTPDVNPDTASYFFTIYYQNSLTGFAGGLGGVIYKTTNTGVNWTRSSIDSSFYIYFPVRRIKFYDSMIGYACGGQFDFAGVAWVTTNGGLSWSANGIAPEPDFDFKIFSADKVIFAGGDLEYGTAVVTSTDQGMHWRYDTTGCYGVARAITYRTPSEVWMPLSFSQRWAVNLDSGNANYWFCIPAPDTTSVYDATFMSPTFGWAVGCFGYICTGTILKYNTSIIGLSEQHISVPERFVLFQNYPNPFNPSTVIKYYLPKSSDVELTVFDALGREVRNIRQYNLSAGFHSESFNGSGLASGVYFYRVIAGEFSDFKKMVLIK